MIRAQKQQLTKPSHRKPRSPSQSQPSRRKKGRGPTGGSARRHQPIFFWGGLWAIVFLVGITALANLLNPAASKDPQFAQTKVRSSTTTTIQPATTQSTGGQGQLPVWLFGAIILSCSASSLILARHLAPVSAHRHRSRQRPKPRPAQTPTRKPQPPLLSRPVTYPPSRPAPPLQRQDNHLGQAMPPDLSDDSI